MNIKYYNPPKSKQSYPEYVDQLRVFYTIRIEIRDKSDTKETHTKMHNKLVAYLKCTLLFSDYEMQKDTGHNGRHYVWFMHKEDALAFALKFGGSVV